MSCGKPHETDCSQVLAEVWLLLDHECDSAQRHKLVEHLDECSPCLEQYGIEEHLKVLLARKCGGEHAPEGFRQRLRDAAPMAGNLVGDPARDTESALPRTGF